ncbi:MAG: beta-Ala-His dipeptidase [Candidatus Sabulitectum sp.]|nr:beta-Ala-His dipeptidase [Candidatus Sabulitectum sp.]
MFPEELSTKPVWRFFKEICSIPHTSGDETMISGYLKSFARERALQFDHDAPGNVLIRKPGSGHPVMLQSHMDMVGEKIAGSNHNFHTDPIDAVLMGDRLVANETTLGADDGIGVALMLELLDGHYPGLPPMECLFTVDEERGLVGALQFPPEWITAKKLINLDSEDLGCITIGCAGGKDVHINLKEISQRYSGDAVKITVDDLNGGHSGIEIGSGNGNAIKLLARVCRQMEELLDGRLISIAGGTKHNAIPRSAEAYMAVEDLAGARALCSIITKDLLEEFTGIEKNITIACEEVESDHCLVKDSSERIIDVLLALPHGVKKMSGVVNGLVETSCNVAIAAWNDEENELSVLLSVRSAVESAKEAHCESIAAVGRLAGAVVSMGNGYPGWAPDSSSELLKTAQTVYRKCFGSDPAVEAIHAGLECGIIGERVGNLDMISLGPDISDVHIPGESVGVSSVASFFDYLVDILKELPA